jgi:2-polyprenyl-6-methoxyphenol hydroxylase-like FAD-dependent oxidoreductase
MALSPEHKEDLGMDWRKTSFAHLMEMGDSEFSRFLEDSVWEIVQTLQGRSPAKREFQCVVVRDLLELSEEQFARFLPDWQEWHKSIRAGSVAERLFRILGLKTHIVPEMTWFDDGVVGLSRVQLTVHAAEDSDAHP